jgi:phosphosulfolactate synthase (CoM biosynthesis protein A)
LLLSGKRRRKYEKRIRTQREGFFVHSPKPAAQKPRTAGITEIRGPYYTPVGKRYLEDLFDMMGGYIDALKFAGGSFALMPRKAVVELIRFCHERDVLVSTGGFIERVLAYGPEAVDSTLPNAATLASTLSRSLRGLSLFRWMTCCGLWNRFRKAA